MARYVLELGEWLPDLPALGHPAATVACNVYPDARGYRPIPAPAPLSEPLPSTCLGALSLRASDGLAYTFAADASHLYRLESTASGLFWRTASPAYTASSIAFSASAAINDTAGGFNAIFETGMSLSVSGASATANNGLFTSISVTASVITTTEQTIANDAKGKPIVLTANFALGGGYGWEWTRWEDQLYAFTTQRYPVKATIESGNFSRLTSSLKAQHAGVVRNFLMVGDTWDSSDGQVPYRVRWCAFNNPTSWTPDPATQSDYQDLPGSAGRVQRISSGEEAWVFCERSIFRFTYVGSPVVFQIDETFPGVGTPAPRSVVQVGATIYFLAHDGFKALAGGQLLPIGAGKVDRWFSDTALGSKVAQVAGTADTGNGRVLWAFHAVSEAYYDRVLVYDWRYQRWSYAEIPSEGLFEYQSAGVTLEQLDALYGTLEAVPYSLDSSVWSQGLISIAYIDTAHRLASPGPSPLVGTVETGEQALSGPLRTRVLRLRPLVESLGPAPSIEASLGTRSRQQDATVWSTALTPNASGAVPVRSNARYHRVRLTLSGDWSRAVGVEVEGVPEGKR